VARTYQLRRRAERQADTRRRIVEAAVALHTSVGPLQTTVSAIAERAGVQRHTFYRHFPDARSLSMACSGLFVETYPLPDPDPWRRVADAEARLRRGLREMYRYYEAHAERLAPLVRDAETDALTRETMELRIGERLAELVEVLAEPFKARGSRRDRLLAVLGAVLDFSVWRTLRSRSGSTEETVEAAVRAVAAQ
jgi:AcrR family transcriptional regulator